MREKSQYKAAAGALLLGLAITVTGCRSGDHTAEPEPTAAYTPVSGSEPVPAASPVQPSTSPDTQNQEKQSNAANAVQQAGAGDTSGNQVAAPVPAKSRKTFEAYSVEKPQLMGVAVGEAQSKTVQLHGQPFSTYVMEDADPITVFEYEGFNVGFNGSKTVEFVEIATDDIDPGLNGLRLGQTTADALQALGKPDASTEYVWSYKTKQTILKLDVDPKTKTLQSIKLFRRDEP
jgi:Tfp pilus assembly protein PilP